MMHHVQIASDLATLTQRAAELWFASAKQSISEHNAFYVALSGGTTPKPLYTLLAQPDFTTRIDWQRVHVFFTDERCVAPSNKQSNYGMIKTTLLSHVPIPEKQIHRMQGELPDLGQAAKEYSKALADLPLTVEGLPQFDLILLGVGSDGHIASLFPGATILPESQNWVATVHAEKLTPPRLSLTLPVINAARRLLVLLSGQEKAAIVHHIFHEEKAGLPAQLIRSHPHIYWHLDQEAARLMSSDTREGERSA